MSDRRPAGFRFVFMADCQLGCYATFSGMTDDDLGAIVAYLRSIPAKKQKIPDRVLEPAARKSIGEIGP